MDTAHHRINERIGYAYDQPHYWDLMAVCYQCHDHIHGKGENDEFFPGGPGDLGDNGFSRNKDTPGHWKTFIIDAVSWKAILPEIGPVCYDLTKQPKGNYRTFRKYHDSGNTFKNDRIILYVENQEAHEGVLKPSDFLGL